MPYLFAANELTTLCFVRKEMLDKYPLTESLCCGCGDSYTLGDVDKDALLLTTKILNSDFNIHFFISEFVPNVAMSGSSNDITNIITYDVCPNLSEILQQHTQLFSRVVYCLTKYFNMPDLIFNTTSVDLSECMACENPHSFAVQYGILKHFGNNNYIFVRDIYNKCNTCEYDVDELLEECDGKVYFSLNDMMKSNVSQQFDNHIKSSV
jgi:hypothetical protein